MHITLQLFPIYVRTNRSFYSSNVINHIGCNNIEVTHKCRHMEGYYFWAFLLLYAFLQHSFVTHQQILLYLIVVIIYQAELWGDLCRSNSRCECHSHVLYAVEKDLQVIDIFVCVVVCNGKKKIEQYNKYLRIYRLQGSLIHLEWRHSIILSLSLLYSLNYSGKIKYF
jgi:hypothetical protein